MKKININNHEELKKFKQETQEVHKHFHDYYGIVNSDTNEFAKVDDIIHIAKHFFQLGLSVNNPITAADRGIANEIIFALKALGEKKMISYDKEIEWLRNKVQKGE